jgi:hypothetical protein
MTAGMLDHRNIGSNISFTLDDGGVISGALAVVVQRGSSTEIVLAHDDEAFEVGANTDLEVSLPAGAAYTLHLKNAVEEFLARKPASA